MAEYIEREAAVMGVLGLTIVDPAVAQYCDAVLLQIQQAPAADVAPVVRCKDCENYADANGKDSGKPCGYGQCKLPTGIKGIVCADDFCSFAERREDG